MEETAGFGVHCCFVKLSTYEVGVNRQGYSNKGVWNSATCKRNLSRRVTVMVAAKARNLIAPSKINITIA